MGVLKFQFDPPDLAAQLPELRLAYFTGLDRTPDRTDVDVRPGQLVCSREGPESGRLNVSWPVAGHGAPVLTTATLAERDAPFELAIELARGRLNILRNQAADWKQLGLACPEEFDRLSSESERMFGRAAISHHDRKVANESARLSLEKAVLASQMLVDAYTEQVLRRRLEITPRLPTLLSCSLPGDPSRTAGMAQLSPAINTLQIDCPWSRLAPAAGRFRWDEFDAQLSWARLSRLLPTAGPLIDLRPGALPDWLWLWSGDYDQIMNLVEDLVREAVGRYRGKVAVWHLLHRVGSGEILGLTEEEQFRITARSLQVARRADPNAQLIVDFDRPWGDWLATSHLQIGPLHLADSLARLELGMTGIGLEIAPGYDPLGSLVRDPLEFSRLLDLFSLINLPIFVSFAIPSATGPDPKADSGVSVSRSQWPSPWTEPLHAEWVARWLALAVAKPFVRGVHWTQASDAQPHLFPHAGLLRPDHSAKPVVKWLEGFRSKYLE